MTDFSPNLGMPFLEEGQANADITHNEALLILDTLVQTRVKDKDLNTPPVSPAEGDRYIVAAVATGDWTGNEDKIAFFFGGIWKFITPLQGWRAFVEDELVEYNFNGTAWVTGGVGSGLMLLQANIDSAAGIILQTSAVGVALSTALPATGTFDLFFTGVTSSNVSLMITANETVQSGGGRATFIEKVTANGVGTGRPTITGARVAFVELEHLTCGGCPFMDRQGVNGEFTIELKEMN